MPVLALVNYCPFSPAPTSPEAHRISAHGDRKGAGPREGPPQCHAVLSYLWAVRESLCELRGRRRELRADSVQCLEECRRR